MADQRPLHVKVVAVVKKDVIRPDRSGGGGPEFFREVTDDFRGEIVSQIDELAAFLEKSSVHAAGVPVVGKVSLLKKAMAKSHRPKAIFDYKTCPVIGGRDANEMLVSVTPDGVNSLRHRVRTTKSQKGEAALTTIQSIEPYTAEDAAGSLGVAGLQKYVKEKRPVLRCELFSHGQAIDKKVAAAFVAQAKAEGAVAELVRADSPLPVYRVDKVSPKAAVKLAEFPGTRRLSTFATYYINQASGKTTDKLTDVQCPGPTKGRSYPVVGIVDTAVAKGLAVLEPWIAGRYSIVPEVNRIAEHGTFVAGLVANASALNGLDARFPRVTSRVFSVEALGKDGLTQERLEQVLEQMLIEHPEIRVWNLSLQQDDPCTDTSFSDLARFLDELSDRFDVIFVVAAGNTNGHPPRRWPASSLGAHDRICGPADSVRALTVGSIASQESKTTLARKEEPSPFSRRGPGPAFLPKPEIVHYGGNCDGTGKFDGVGVKSMCPKGHTAESIGTSFAAPIVSTVVANLDGLVDMPVSRPLAKAILVHSAQLGSEIPHAELPYRGFGRPGDVAQLISCAPNEATLIFEPQLRYGQVFEKNPFPIPACMRTASGKFQGEIIATIAYDPPVNPKFVAEYCRTELEFSFGTWEAGKKPGTYEQHGKVPPLPTKPEEMREEFLVKERFKWSPVRVHRKKFPRGTEGDVWRMALTLFYRDNEEATSLPPQRAAVIVTLRGLNKTLPVHAQMEAAMTNAGWLVNDLTLRDTVRARVRS